MPDFPVRSLAGKDKMTMKQISATIEPIKPCGRTMLINYIRKLKIKPLGARQRPQRFPDDTAARILIYLGFEGDGQVTARAARAGVRLPSLNQLNKERRTAQKARAK
jgi:hypothetical protein